MRKTFKKAAVLTLCVATALVMATGCSKDNNDSKNSSGKDGKSYKIGICQIVQHEALDAASKGFKDAVVEKLGKDNVTFDEQNAQGDSATCTTIINGFVSSDVDLILANATAPLETASNATENIPILGTSITDYSTALGIELKDGKTGINVSGTSDLAPLDGQAELVKELFPDAKSVGLIYCTAEANSKFQIENITKELTKLGFEVKEYGFTDSNDIAAVVTKATEDSDVLYIPTDNTAASNTEVIDSIARPAKKPIIAGEENICKGCGVATLSISYYDIGYETGLMAAEILKDGKKIEDMPIAYAPKFEKKYNKAIAEELGVTIPEGYEEIKID